MIKTITSAVVSLLTVSLACSRVLLAQSAPDDKYDGVVVARIDAAVTPFVNGIVTAIEFKPGQQVKTGDLLFQLYSESYEAEKQLALAKLHQAEALLKSTKDTFSRYEELIKRNAVPEMKYVNAKIEQETAAAKVAEARANLRRADLNLALTRIVSPLDGKISRSFVRLGAYVEAAKDNDLAVVTQLDPINVEFQIPYELYRFQHRRIREDRMPLHSIKLGLVLPDGKIYPHIGGVEFHDPEFDKKTQLLTAWGAFPNPEYLLRPGLQVKVFVQP